MDSKPTTFLFNGLVRSTVDIFNGLSTHSSLLVPMRERLASDIEELCMLGATGNGSVPTGTAVASFSPDDYAMQDVFHRRWKRFMRGLLEQWQVINYVSAVLVG